MPIKYCGNENQVGDMKQQTEPDSSGAVINEYRTLGEC